MSSARLGEEEAQTEPTKTPFKLDFAGTLRQATLHTFRACQRNRHLKGSTNGRETQDGAVIVRCHSQPLEPLSLYRLGGQSVLSTCLCTEHRAHEEAQSGAVSSTCRGQEGHTAFKGQVPPGWGHDASGAPPPGDSAGGRWHPATRHTAPWHTVHSWRTGAPRPKHGQRTIKLLSLAALGRQSSVQSGSSQYPSINTPLLQLKAVLVGGGRCLWREPQGGLVPALLGSCWLRASGTPGEIWQGCTPIGQHGYRAAQHQTGNPRLCAHSPAQCC